MRLIDADEALRLMFFEEYKYQYEENYGYREAEKFIANQPTVEAIPIEWVEKWLHNYYDFSTINYDYLKNSDVYKMLADWEKENEID